MARTFFNLQQLNQIQEESDLKQEYDAQDLQKAKPSLKQEFHCIQELDHKQFCDSEERKMLVEKEDGCFPEAKLKVEQVDPSVNFNMVGSSVETVDSVFEEKVGSLQSDTLVKKEPLDGQMKTEGDVEWSEEMSVLSEFAQTDWPASGLIHFRSLRCFVNNEQQCVSQSQDCKSFAFNDSDMLVFHSGTKDDESTFGPTLEDIKPALEMKSMSEMGRCLPTNVSTLGVSICQLKKRLPLDLNSCFPSDQLSSQSETGITSFSRTRAHKGRKKKKDSRCSVQVHEPTEGVKKKTHKQSMAKSLCNKNSSNTKRKGQSVNKQSDQKVKVRSSCGNNTNSSKHKSQPAAKKILMCVKCNAEFGFKSSLRSHLKDVHSEKLYPCELCETSFICKRYLKTHMCNVHSGKPFSCNHCHAVFSTKSNLKRHIQEIHGPHVRKYACNQCDKKYTSNSHLRAHIQQNHSDNMRRYVCHVCGFRFKTSSHLNAHMYIHTGQRPFVCEFCRVSFNKSTHLKMHKLKNHSDLTLECSTCKLKFTSKLECDQHTQLHNGGGHVCAVCDAWFEEKGNLKAHLRTHTGERPFRCSTCQATFSQRSVLTSHVRRHTGEKPYSCYICAMTFIQSQSMRDHMRRWHPGQMPWACEKCDLKFQYKREMKLHVYRDHVG